MKWSFKLLKISGITIKLHLTFLLLLVMIAFAGFVEHGVIGLARPILYILLFITIALHEIGHSIAAKFFGIKVKDITLLPIGGMARLEKLPEKPIQEAILAISGPVVSLLISLFLFTFVGYIEDIYEFSRVMSLIGKILLPLARINLILAVFNLLPAFPMDGGRLLRAILSMKINYITATNISALIGQGMAILFGFIGLFFNPWLLFVALFIYICAEEEAYLVKLKSTIKDVPVYEFMITNDFIVSPSTTVKDLINKMSHTLMNSFVVVGSNEIMGVVTKDKLLSSIESLDLEMPITEIMTKNFKEVDYNSKLSDIFNQTENPNELVFIAKKNNEPVGIVTFESITKFFLFESIRKKLRK